LTIGGLVIGGGSGCRLPLRTKVCFFGSGGGGG